MYPDFNAIVNEFIRPVVSLFLFIFLVMGWVTAFMLMKENTSLRFKLGQEDEKVQEDFRTRILRKTASVLLPIYSLKNYLYENRLIPTLKQLAEKRTKIIKLAFRLVMVSSIVSTIFRINSSSTN
jgi:hypothetical protein